MRKTASFSNIGPPKANMSLDEGGNSRPRADGAALTGPANPVANDDSYVFLIWQQIYDIYQVRSRLGSLCFAAPERVLSKTYLTKHRERRAVTKRSGRGRPHRIRHKIPARVAQSLPGSKCLIGRNRLRRRGAGA